jgi:enoyl-CoA hydratase
MDLETVRLDVADFIATVTIDRPPVNAQNQKAREALIMTS